MVGPTLGVFGGTFDPLHIGHLVVAQDALESLALDRMLIVPAGRPPHRDPVLPERVRLETVRRAFAGDPRMEVVDVEMKRPGRCYTIDTLEWVAANLGPAELYLVIGADQYAAFDEWRRPEAIVGLAKLAVMTRSGGPEVPEDSRFPFRNVEVTRVDLSSTRIRERLAEGRSIRYLVPETTRAAVESAWRESGRAAGTERIAGSETTAGAGARGGEGAAETGKRETGC